MIFYIVCMLKFGVPKQRKSYGSNSRKTRRDLEITDWENFIESCNTMKYMNTTYSVPNEIKTKYRKFIKHKNKIIMKSTQV